MRGRVIYLIRTYLWTVIVFVIAKVGFIYSQLSSFNFTDVCQVISHGLSLDLSTALYFLIVPFLVTMVSVWWNNRKILHKILYTYYIIIATAFALAFVADASLYPFWGFKLDASCLQYLSTPNEAAASVTTGFLLVRLLAIILIAAIIFGGYLSATRKYTSSVSRIPKISETVFYIICIPLIVIGIRGGIDESTTNIGQVYYSQNQFLNHSAVNPVFSFLASFEKTASNNTVYEFMDDDDCNRIIRELYNTESIGSDTLLTTSTPNIIIILMESCGGQFTEIGGRDDITPNLNRLAKEGIYFTNCYANSWRTDRGTVCTYSGYPSFPTMSVMKMPSKTRTLPNIARSLQTEKGYNTHYLYGGDINFTNMRSYLVSGGFAELKWKEDYSAEEQRSAKWGVRDDITFETLYQMSTTLPSPYLIGYSTLSSHEPWDVPITGRQGDKETGRQGDKETGRQGDKETGRQGDFDEVENAFYYLDQCIGHYIKRLRQSPLWDNTLVIMLPDHGINHGDVNEQHPLKNHIPMIWVGGAIKAPKRIEEVCNQTDLPATLLGQLGISHQQYTFSRDVLSQTYTQPFAIETYTEGFSMYDSVSFVNYDMISDRVVVEQGRKNPELIKRAKAILQAASKDLREK